MPRTINLGIGFGEDIAFLHLRAISMAEENAFLARFTELKDLNEEERIPREKEICVDGLAAWSVKPPTKKVGEKEFEYFENTGADEAVRQFFSKEDQDNERLANAAVLNYRGLLSPRVVF